MNSKYIIKGLLLALTMIILDNIWIKFGTNSFNHQSPAFWVETTFAVTVMVFILTKKLKKLFLTIALGFGSLIFLNFFVIFPLISLGVIPNEDLITYQADNAIKLFSSEVLGSFLGAVIAIIWTKLKLCKIR